MSSHRLGILFLCFIFVALNAPAQEVESARIGEKPFAEWIAQWRGATPVERQALLDNLEPANAAAWPEMLALLEDADPQARELACLLVQSRYQEPERITAALQSRLDDSVPRVRFLAAKIAMSADWKHCDPRCWTLLFAFARGDDPALRLEAVWQLGGSVRVEPRVVDLLLEYVESDDLELRRAAYSGLENGEDERSRAAQQTGLSDPDEQIRVHSARALAYSNNGGDVVAAVLLELVGSRDDYVRATAFNVMAQLGAERASDVAPAMIAALRDPESGVRYQAAFALGVLGNDGAEIPDAVPALVELVNDSNPSVRGAAAFALGHVGATTEVAVPAIATLIQDPNDETRGLALDSLKQAGADVVYALPKLIQALDDPKAVTRAWVAQLIALGGPRSKEAVAPLTARLSDPNLLARTWCAYALREIGAASAPATPRLVESLTEDPEPQMRVEAARTLAAIGPLAGSAADALVVACKDPELDVRLWSLFALGELGVKNDAVLAALKEAAAASDARVLAEANKALAKIGELHNVAAIANAPGTAPALLEPVLAVITYGGPALILSDANGAAIVAFSEEFGGVEGKTERRGVHYYFRYLAKGQTEATTGEGELREVLNARSSSFREQDAAESRTDILAGPLKVAWSFLAPGSGFIYWRPETLRVELGNSGAFETLDLSRFVR